jgi:hemerythrin-like domain-containing protein
MDPINVLMNEHRVIEQVLDALEAFTRDLAQRGEADREQLRRFAMFIREFADATHHGKEEDILFVKMMEVGFPRESGPLAVMFSDHETGRKYAAVLRAAAERTGQPWTEEEVERVGRAAVGYIELLRAHIYREDTILYVMARQRIPSDDLYQMGKRFTAMMAEQEASGNKQRLYALAAELTGQIATG